MYCSDQISLEEKIGQMIIVGFHGKTIHENKILKKQISYGHISGVVLHSYNFDSKEELATLTNDINNIASKIPLFISVDQEGGYVSRLSEKNGFTNFASAKDIATKKTVNEASLIYLQMAKMLATVDINLNLAPDCDVDINPQSPAIGKWKRSFSANPSTVVKYAHVFIEAHKKEHILTAIKHYPGHGSATGDTHNGMVDVTNTWDEKEIIPFAELIKNSNVDIIMTAHIMNKSIDTDYPASLSQIHINEILRKKLDYNGVVITDDLQMGAISKNYGFKESIIKAINAGSDILLFANSYNNDPNLVYKIIDTIVQAINEKIIDINKINKSYERIMKLKNLLSASTTRSPIFLKTYQPFVATA